MKVIEVIVVCVIEHDGETYERSAGGSWSIRTCESMEPVYGNRQAELELLYQDQCAEGCRRV